MTPVRLDQKPNGCWAACLAMLTGVPLEELPQPTEDQVQREAWHEYQNGLIMALHRHGWAFAHLGTRVPAGFAIASGPGPRGMDHCCVYLDGELWHDPHLSRAGLLSVTGYEVVIPVLWAWTELEIDGNATRAAGWRWVGAAAGRRGP